MFSAVVMVNFPHREVVKMTSHTTSLAERRGVSRLKLPAAYESVIMCDIDAKN
jgi:hypothetical protein